MALRGIPAMLKGEWQISKWILIDVFLNQIKFFWEPEKNVPEILSKSVHDSSAVSTICITLTVHRPILTPCRWKCTLMACSVNPTFPNAKQKQPYPMYAVDYLPSRLPSNWTRCGATWMSCPRYQGSWGQYGAHLGPTVVLSALVTPKQNGVMNTFLISRYGTSLAVEISKAKDSVDRDQISQRFCG